MSNLTTENFIQKARKIHGDKYDYSLVDYKNNHTKIKIICPIHGVFEQIPGNHLNGSGCKYCGFNKGEQKKRVTSESFIKKAKEKFPQYDYSLVDYKHTKIKVKIICPVHGEFFTRASDLLAGRGCPKCGKTQKLTTEEFIKKAKEVHGDRYNYDLVDYKNKRTKVRIICPIHGEFEQLPGSHIRGCGCNNCSSSKGNENIKNFLIKNNFIENKDFFREKEFNDLKFKKLLRYDFYIPSKNLLIEYNGEQHQHWTKYYHKTYHDFLVQKHRDWLKRDYARKHNISFLVLWYFDKDYLQKIKNALS